MFRTTFVALLTVASAATAFAQPMSTKLDAAAGIPELDGKTTQTEDVRFKTGAMTG